MLFSVICNKSDIIFDYIGEISKKENAMEDKRIIELLFARSEEGIELIRQKYSGLCMGIALRNLGDLQDAEECFNDVLLKAWSTIPPNDPRSLAAYLGSLTRNTSVDKFRCKTASQRKCGLEKSLSELEGCLPSSAADDISDELTLKQCIDEFLASLEKEERVIFMRRYWYANTDKEIAEMTGLSPTAVRVKLHRARKKLKNHLERNGIHI